MATASDPSDPHIDPPQPGRTSRRADKHPPVITEAKTSFEEEQRARIRRYAIMMSFRIPALVIAVVVYMRWENVWLALIIVAVSVPLPWMAVVMANDGPPKRKERLQRYEPERYRRGLESQSRPALEDQPPTVEG